jgi:hypothetical protein
MFSKESLKISFTRGLTTAFFAVKGFEKLLTAKIAKKPAKNAKKNSTK